jgi:hypothetical protein
MRVPKIGDRYRYECADGDFYEFVITGFNPPHMAERYACDFSILIEVKKSTNDTYPTGVTCDGWPLDLADLNTTFIEDKSGDFINLYNKLL